jgi:hypothetical protein
MTLESKKSEITDKIIKRAPEVAESSIRKIWTILDAASEKELPSEFLSRDAVRAIQGKQD